MFCKLLFRLYVVFLVGFITLAVTDYLTLALDFMAPVTDITSKVLPRFYCITDSTDQKNLQVRYAGYFAKFTPPRTPPAVIKEVGPIGNMIGTADGLEIYWEEPTPGKETPNQILLSTILDRKQHTRDGKEVVRTGRCARQPSLRG